MSTSEHIDREDCWPPGRVLILASPDIALPLSDALAALGIDLVRAGEQSSPAAEADLIVCDPAAWRTLRTPQGAQSTPVVVLDAAESERAGFLADGACVVSGSGFDAKADALQIAALVRRLRMERDRSPLTGLPGNRWLQAHLRGLLDEGRRIGLLLLDVDHFKWLNDRHGHLIGDAIIELLAEAAVEVAAEHGDAMVAHVGGDDFCIVMAPGGLSEVGPRIQREFERRSAGLLGREGEDQPTLTAVATVIDGAQGPDLMAAFGRLAELKDAAKTQPGSTYICRETGRSE
jgi:diguanylate cyclase (GGDEF)-like protein